MSAGDVKFRSTDPVQGQNLMPRFLLHIHDVEFQSVPFGVRNKQLSRSWHAFPIRGTFVVAA